MYTTILKTLRKLYSILNAEVISSGRNWKIFPTKEYANDLIFDKLMADHPTMIARLGANELNCMVNYLGVTNKVTGNRVLNFIRGQGPAWWWEEWMMKQMCENAGFFPKEPELFTQFSILMINELQNVDLLGSWLNNEKYFQNELSNSKKVMLEDLEPFFCKDPWTKALKSKCVLVVHPFEETIKAQYKKRNLLFQNELLPSFELKTIKAVQSHGEQKTKFRDFFEALNFMKDEIDKVDFDICILGCGAYGFPLAAHIKRMGKKAIHLGGATQLLFGIKGKRWEEYIVYPYTNLFNEHWVRPNENEKPEGVNKVEGATYW